MGENTPGHRKLADHEVMLVELIRSEGVSLDSLIKSLQNYDADDRWVAVGKTHLQQGLMALTRAVVQPEFF